jgi:D-3-phosphoglycerate dehydrogenase
MARWKVVVTAPRACEAIGRYRDALGAAGCDVESCPPAERFDEAALLPLVRDADAVVCGDDRFTDLVFEAAQSLKVVAKWGTGIDSIDLDSASRRGVRVCNTPDAFSDPVADSVLGYVLLFARRLDRMSHEVREGLWTHAPLRSLSECAIGIVGFGNIGTAVARRAAAFKMRILACDVRPLADSAAAELGVRIVMLEQLLAESDFVTLHADLRAGNRKLVNAQRLALMRQTAVLINTARGELVDEDALLFALQKRQIAGAALDVFREEPLPPTSALRQLENVYLAPHNANSSAAAAERVHANTIRNVLEVLGTSLP